MRFNSASFLWLGLVACSSADSPVAPNEGPLGGGFTVRIQGQEFLGHGPPIVYFGEQPAKGVVVESDWLIRVKSPESANEGTVDIAIVFADGELHEFPGAFTYIGANVVQLPER